jgi:hypothetical protein
MSKEIEEHPQGTTGFQNAKNSVKFISQDNAAYFKVCFINERHESHYFQHSVVRKPYSD